MKKISRTIRYCVYEIEYVDVCTRVFHKIEVTLPEGEDIEDPVGGRIVRKTLIEKGEELFSLSVKEFMNQSLKEQDTMKQQDTTD